MAGSRYRVVAARPTRRNPDGIDAGGATTGVEPDEPEPDEPLPEDVVRGSSLDGVLV
jgi:hypothetical protein